MTQPRNVRPNVTWFVTRRATRRHFLFSPDPEAKVEQIYWYTTAVIAQRLGVQLHMMQQLSSHLHEVLTDILGVLPRFFELRNRILANALKVLLGWPEEVFAKTPANWVELSSADAIIKEMAYTAANCVEAGLVRTPRRWPGAKVLVDEVGQKTITVQRPEGYFDPDNPMWPERVSIPIEMPEILRDAFETEQDARDAIQAELDERVRKAHADNAREGRGYLGAKRVLKTPHTSRASSFERFGSRTPTFAAAGNLAVAKELVRRLRAFRAAYREAWQAWKAGVPGVVFPHGTWRMRVYYGAACEEPP